MDHHDLPLLLVMLPWLGFIGAPFLTRTSAREFWNVDLFVLRFLALVMGETALFVTDVVFLTLPLGTLYAVLDDNRPLTPPAPFDARPGSGTAQ